MRTRTMRHLTSRHHHRRRDDALVVVVVVVAYGVEALSSSPAAVLVTAVAGRGALACEEYP